MEGGYWVNKKQGAISRSISEAEVISFEAGLRMEGIPCLSLVDELYVLCLFLSNCICIFICTYEEEDAPLEHNKNNL